MGGCNATSNNEITMAIPKAGFNTRPENINKDGRPPKGYSITETIKAMMDEKPEIKKALGQKILEMALRGDITAMKTLWQYMDGMPKQTTDIKLEQVKPLLENVHSNHSSQEAIETKEED